MMLQNTHLSMHHVLFCFKKKGEGGGERPSKELYLTGAPSECSMNKKRECWVNIWYVADVLLYAFFI